MRRHLAALVALLLLAGPSSAAYKLSMAVAPAIVQGDVERDLAPWAGRAIAEIVSWEVSAVQTIRVVDPVTLEKSLDGWTTWTDLAQPQVDAVRSAGRLIDAEAVVLPRIEKRGFESNLQVAVVVYRNMAYRTIRFDLKGPDDAVLAQLRQQLVNSLDSLGFNVPAALRIAASQKLNRTKWDAVLEFGRGLQSISLGNKEEALRRFQESQRLDPNIPATVVRIKTLEKDIGR